MNITYLINKYPDKPWNWPSLSANKNITIQDILSMKDKPWNWSKLSRCANIKDVLNNPDKPWDWFMLSANKI